MPQIPRPRFALDHDELLQLDGELDQNDRRDETLLVQKRVEIARKALEFGPILDVFDEIDVGVVATVTSDADVVFRVEIIHSGASRVVDVLLLLQRILVGLEN